MQACTSLDVDIISLDLARKLPFKLAPSALQAAVKRGIHFEVTLYSSSPMLCLQQEAPLVHGSPQLSAQAQSVTCTFPAALSPSRPAPRCSLAVAHSLQVLVAPTLRDESGRRTAFANAAALSRGTRGRGIILSSGAQQAYELRGPYDVANLGTLFGLTETSAKVSLLKAPAALRRINGLLAAGGCEPKVRGCDSPCHQQEGFPWSCVCL